MKGYTEYYVQDRLRPFIDCIWREEETANPDNYERIFHTVPDNTIEFIITEHSIVRKNLINGKHEVLKSHVSCFKTQAQKIYLTGNPTLSIRFKPEIFWTLTSQNPAETIDQSIDPSELFGGDIWELQDQLLCTDCWPIRINLVENYFAKKLTNSCWEDKVFQYAERCIYNGNGDVDLSRLSKSIGTSQKSLERLFQKRLGLSPKKYCRLIRFFVATKLLNTSLSRTQVAYECGFFDQMHFIKDFRKVTGMTPKDYLRKDRSLQEGIFSI